MLYEGYVQGGVVVFGPGEHPPEGTRVRVLPVETDGEESVEAALRRAGLIGCLAGGADAPRDLATNPAHMEGFGCDPLGDR